MRREIRRPLTPAPADADPFFFGYRPVRVQHPDGTSEMVNQPLTYEDVLHPTEGDHIMHSTLHQLMLEYLHSVLAHYLKADPDWICLSDCKIIWPPPVQKHHSPDNAVFSGVRVQRVCWPSFDVAEEGATIEFIIEVTSPSTRYSDLVDKVSQYATAGVPFYFIADHEDIDEPWTLIGMKLVEGQYVEYPPDDTGRYRLGRLNVWLGAEGTRLLLYDRDGRLLGDYSHVVGERDAAILTGKRIQEISEARVETAETARAEAERQRDELARQRNELARQRDEAVRRQAEADRQRDEAVRRQAEADRLLTEALAKLRALEDRSPPPAE